eukprot:scaffold105568_cov37-Tisochrysis_lutea.AAC.4
MAMRRRARTTYTRNMSKARTRTHSIAMHTCTHCGTRHTSATQTTLKQSDEPSYQRHCYCAASLQGIEPTHSHSYECVRRTTE